MFHKKHFLILLLTLIFSTAVFIFSPRDTQAGDTFLPGEEKIWTSWLAYHYTLIDDGPILWIGTGSGLTRYEKESGQHTRYATPDGFPHRQVFSGAVDSDGNRWFGGDGGLSRLDADQQWTHFDIGNSDIHNNYVFGIAVSAGGDVWLSHLGSPKISHRRPDGTWQIFDNREAAVSAAYTAVKETINENDLWAVFGNEVWVGYKVYDGVQWQTRKPEGAYFDPQYVAADSQGTIWALDYDRVFRWKENMWSMYSVDYSSILFTLAIDATDKVWVGGDKPVYGVPVPLPDEPAFTSLPEEPGTFTLDQTIDFPPPLIDLLPTAEGLWVTGDNWLLKAGGESVVFSDVPYFYLNEFFVDKNGIRRLSSATGTLQIFDDMGTATIKDDIWAFDDSMQGNFDSLELVENGDFWMAGKSHCFKFCHPWIERYHDGQTINYEQPDWDYDYLNHDIFAEDSRQTWFVFAQQYWDGYYRIPVIYHLDDGGTPANQDDDVWTEYPTPADAHKEIVTNHHLIAASNGRLWYGHPKGVYRRQGQDWELITPVIPYEFVPAADGTLIVNTGEGKVLIISPNGQQVVYTIACLVASRPELIRSTTRRNQMWTVAPDGAIWYWNDQGQLVRWHELGVQIFDTLVQDPYIEVDRNNHVWLNSEETLWRMSPKPDFDISSGPSTWLMLSSESRSGIITAVDISGYAEEITLTISDLPPGVSAEIVPEVVHAGKAAVLTLTTENVPLGEYSFAITGTSGEKARSREIKLHVVKEVHTLDLPLVMVQGY